MYTDDQVKEIIIEVASKNRDNLQCGFCDSMDTEFKNDLSLVCLDCGEVDNFYKKIFEKINN